MAANPYTNANSYIDDIGYDRCMTTSPSTDYEPQSSLSLKDPARDYASLHAARVWVYADFSPTLYVLSRYEDVRDALSNSSVFSSAHGNRPRPMLAQGLQSDPPAHTTPRTLLQNAFVSSLTSAVRDTAAVKAADLLANLKTRAHWDLHDDYALPLSISVLGKLVGVPAEEMELFQYYSEAQALSTLTPGTNDRQDLLNEDQADFSEYLLNKIIATRKGVHKTGIIPALIEGADSSQGFTDNSVLTLVLHLLAEGLEPSATLVTNALWRTLPQRRLWQQLEQNPHLVQQLIDESLRFDPPTLAVFRSTTQSNNDYGTQIPSSARVMLHLGAANRDVAVFEEPNRFNAQRAGTRHVSFGLGNHFCVGAQVAQIIANTAIASVRQACPELGLRGQGERTQAFYQWGRRRLPVATKATAGRPA